MRDKLRIKGLAMALAVALAVGTPVSMMQAPVEVSAKTVQKAKKNGLKLENGKYYFYENGKKATKKWKTVGKKKYYFKSNGAAAIGWNKIGDKGYYFTDKAVMVKNKKVDSVKLDSKGRASLTTRVRMLVEVQSVLDKRTKSSQTNAQKLKSCYRYMVDKCGYGYPGGGLKMVPQGKPSKWEVSYGYEMLRTKKGNCYSYAAGFAMLARGCGYKATVIVGKIQKPGETARPHAWVDIGNKVYDPQTQSALKGDYGKTVNLCGKDYSKTGDVMYMLPDGAR